MGLTRRFVLTTVLLAFASRGDAQFVTKLDTTTLGAFEKYAGDVERSLQKRWAGKDPLFEIDGRPQDKEAEMKGEAVVHSETPNSQPIEIPGGLIHDWSGAIFMKGATVQNTLETLENFDQHEKIYPNVQMSKTISRQGHKVLGHWRLFQKGMVNVVLDVDQDVQYQQIAPGRWKGTAYARRIVETDTTPFSRHKQFPPDEGHGFLWRLYSYWTLEEQEGGVLAECRTLSLTRDIPEGLAWAIQPYVSKTPRTSLVSTLEQTRKAVATP